MRRPSDRKSSLRLMRSVLTNENGVVLIVGLMFMAILAMVGMAAVFMTTTDLQIGGNYRASVQASNVAEAGAQEARERLRLKPDANHTDAAQWTLYIGTDEKAQKKGYDSTNSMHNRVASLQIDMEYTVIITHQVDESGNVLYWGDADENGTFERHADETKGHPNIYLIKSFGNANGASKLVLMEVTRVPPVPIKAALYTTAGADLQGAVTVNGIDNCEGSVDKPGIATPLLKVTDEDPVNPPSTPNAVTGSLIDKDPNVKYSESPINVQTIVASLKNSANFVYELAADATHTGSTTPGPGDGWGTPDLTASPPTCGSCNIVYYDMGGIGTLTLTGTVTGCGILLVDGDLHLGGSFNWYGTVIVSGALRAVGGGSVGKNVMGAVLTGDTTEGDYVGGSVDIAYCSSATENQNQNYPLTILSWSDGSSG